LQEVGEHWLEQLAHLGPTASMLVNEQPDGVVSRPRDAEVFSESADPAPGFRDRAPRIVELRNRVA
jgi:hypothetical protein